jgi:hypothetical protein
MMDLFKDAEILGIADLPDVHIVANAFKCMCWSSLAMSTLAKRASLKEIMHVISTSESLNLPDEKAVKMLKAMAQRTSQWQAKARKGLLPVPGETTPFNMDMLRSLDDGASSLPFELSEAVCLANAIEDKGCRHCICGGANDGTFMLGCDKCDCWFHGRCVGVEKEIGTSLEHWICPRCSQENTEPLQQKSVDPEEWFDCVEYDDDDSVSSNEDSPCAPTVEKLWPPFQLLGSEKSRELLGETCVLLSDEHGSMESFMKILLDVSQSGEGEKVLEEKDSSTLAHVHVQETVSAAEPAAAIISKPADPDENQNETINSNPMNAERQPEPSDASSEMTAKAGFSVTHVVTPDLEEEEDSKPLVSLPGPALASPEPPVFS